TKTLVQMGVGAAVGGVVGALMIRPETAPKIRTGLQLPLGMWICLGLWLVFSIYWTLAAKNSASTKTSESAASRGLHLVAVNVALILLVFPIPGPIYTAVLGMYCGTAVVSGEIHAPLALLLVAVTYRRKIRLEERALAETFGATHEAYRRKTWALIPGL